MILHSAQLLFPDRYIASFIPGTMWDDFISGESYIGTNGLAAWRDIGCSGDLPLGTNGDTGHWNEDCLGLEIMTPLLRWNRDHLFSGMTMGALEDLGYTVNRAEQDAFGLADLGDCGAACPEARRRRLGMTNTTRIPKLARPKLSEEAQMELLNAAADRFRDQERQLRATESEHDLESLVGSSVSYVYEENGHIFSRTIHRHQVEHLL